MKWTPKLERYRKRDMELAIPHRKFAWFPREVDGKVIWLEWYWRSLKNVRIWYYERVYERCFEESLSPITHTNIVYYL